jgi:hypothetical protein
MSSQQQQSESREFSPSQLNRAIAILHTVLCAAIFVSTSSLPVRMEIAIIRHQTGDFEAPGVHLLAGIIGLFALGILLILIFCLRNIQKPNEGSGMVLSWTLLFFFGLSSFIYGGLLWSYLNVGLLSIVMAYHFGAAFIGFVTAVVRIFLVRKLTETF